ncbi:MAG: 2-C-methyl-D-erythritol 4-phosphate cytidylyltransferase [Desulfobacterales bacterium]|mgnify:CR=1 FL=1|jgi:2-C-methyl-D-erythritol 4-phosphate cytidylyltransferase|nr:2-C-methyl-D-erythritol 4-phosphate cytidylyltransferase [Desulfobacterales bacterium]MDD3081961.1 2-C-methyl-D-erythritol 4-phosphate cytidylyltransferase [Desulfobacterales bacterium]MDY0378552.1 2-C-methyl-D-erythritol 4-phosphate cytidylyltransferase [Desulfobacterales bacterium]
MITALIVAGGSGVRMKDSRLKQYIPLDGLPIVAHTLKAFDACPRIDRLVWVMPQGDLEDYGPSLSSSLGLKKPVLRVAGGLRRQDSVYNGLKALGADDGIVAIHDGVRPFVRSAQIIACIHGAEATGACILGIPAHDTLKQIDESGCIVRTLSREPIWLAQTPQVFRCGLIRSAHEKARSDGVTGTDDAFLVERMGKPVRVIPGSRFNIKITTPEDLVLAEAILRNWRQDE